MGAESDYQGKTEGAGERGEYQDAGCHRPARVMAMSVPHVRLKSELISYVCCLQRMDPASDCTLGKGKIPSKNMPEGASEYPRKGELHLCHGLGKCQVDRVGADLGQGLASDQGFLDSWSSPHSWPCSFPAIVHDDCTQAGLRESSLQSPRDTGPSVSCVPTTALPCLAPQHVQEIKKRGRAPSRQR